MATLPWRLPVTEYQRQKTVSVSVSVSIFNTEHKWAGTRVEVASRGHLSWVLAWSLTPTSCWGIKSIIDKYSLQWSLSRVCQFSSCVCFELLSSLLLTMARRNFIKLWSLWDHFLKCTLEPSSGQKNSGLCSSWNWVWSVWSSKNQNQLNGWCNKFQIKA